MINAEVKMPKNVRDEKIALDRALQKLKSKLITEGTLDTVRAKRAFETPKEKRERKKRKQYLTR